MGIPVGKSIAYSACGGLPQEWLLPVTVDVGCEEAQLRNDQFYTGIKQPRIIGEKYFQILDQVIFGLMNRYGNNLLVHFEDFGTKNAFELLRRYTEYGVSVLNDDIQCTGTVVLGALYGAVRHEGVPQLRDQHVLFFGAGQANPGVAQLFLDALVEEGLSEQEAMDRIWIMDRGGLIVANRKGLSPEKLKFARSASSTCNECDLVSLIKQVKPTCLIGATTVRGAFNDKVLKTLVEVQSVKNVRPIVMALSNPDTKAECTAQQVYDSVGDGVIFASGTAASPVLDKQGKKLSIQRSQVNNAYVFPGVEFGAIASSAITLTQSMLIQAAKSLGNLLTEDEIKQGLILPGISRLNEEISIKVAVSVIRSATVGMVASTSQPIFKNVMNAALGNENVKIEQELQIVVDSAVSEKQQRSM
eukprot:TRINITY_DN11415_c0_g1_i1.p1 TRINITY_DN11415_c0_g1~~TRINITY_DN11415_c0_g1_i1.p1  ORF type:complete len:434 (-),score=38.94 TRINITY_DN11415_c0_g1_i1:101-1348(-)